ncbi:MAG: leucine--tRNA ligase [Lewinellaceae bacterium]|nr:leucine--tRNA ligase [Saprospiraceae bacterium]MCB9311764.1 leucine--tRNA ligase [Lewinellaceae bacterium]
MEYRTKELESRWQSWWNEQGIYRVTNHSGRPKYYVLDMFPYPSGAGLHVGHPLGYIASDIYSRYKRMEGYEVLHPMGFDAFGLPAEQYAIQTGVHPSDSTRENTTRYRAQLKNLGFNYDWSREVNTSDPSYYRWTQWIFLKLFDHWYDRSTEKARPISELKAHFSSFGSAGLQAASAEELLFSAEDWHGYTPEQQEEMLMNYRLAYRRVSYVNWCEALGTVLANDEVKDGLSERGGFPVERRPMLQWSLRITAYANRLLDDLDDLEWSDALKAMQRNWIGRSEGARLYFPIDGSDRQLEIFTTRPDTLFGVTFMVIAPEHELMDELTTTEQRQAVDDYLAYAGARSERERMADVKQMTGVFTGSYAIHPITGGKIPIWTADYVLKDYGSGAIMAVPADDDRDRAFADMAGLPVIEIIDRSEWPEARREDKVGRLIHSDFLDGLEVPQAITRMLEEIETRRIGERKVNFKLRDALFSRQRYWGEPFPIMYDAKGIPHMVPEDELPITLPPLDNFKPTSDGHSPLARVRDWVEQPDGLVRETDTMPGYAGSSWYFLRYMDPTNQEAFASREALAYWQDVDLYIGGTEHAVGHLMYARFWHKFLYDLGYLPTREPFRKLINQGMIQGVIESVFLLKEKVDGKYLFRCAGLVGQEEMDAYIQIPVLIDFVREYGTDSSYLDSESIQRFIEWRPEYRTAIFECSQGRYEDGQFFPRKDAAGSHLVTHSEVGKMSKSKYNVINPDDVVDQYGADCFRMYEMFLGPIEQSKPWDTKGIDGVSKFLRRFWSLFADQGQWLVVTEGQADRDSLRILHQTIQRVTDDLNRFSMNTCVSQFMICVNELKRLDCHHHDVLEPLVRLLAPFAPHLAEELWHRLGHESSVHQADFPKVNEAYLVADEILYPVSINGKKRAEMTVPADMDQQSLESQALALPEIVKWLEGLTVRKMIVVPGRMINIVAG